MPIARGHSEDVKDPTCVHTISTGFNDDPSIIMRRTGFTGITLLDKIKKKRTYNITCIGYRKTRNRRPRWTVMLLCLFNRRSHSSGHTCIRIYVLLLGLFIVSTRNPFHSRLRHPWSLRHDYYGNQCTLVLYIYIYYRIVRACRRCRREFGGKVCTQESAVERIVLRLLGRPKVL